MIEGDREFAVIDFTDGAGAVCSVQRGRGEKVILLWSRTTPRMRLSREMVAALLPALQHFAETGDLPDAEALAKRSEAMNLRIPAGPRENEWDGPPCEGDDQC